MMELTIGVLMFRIIINLFLTFFISSQSIARVQNAFTFTHTQARHNITCWSDGLDYVCAIGVYTGGFGGIQMYDGSGGGPYPFAIRYRFYCPNLSSYSSWTTGNTLSWTNPSSASNNRYISTTTTPALVLPSTASPRFEMWHYDTVSKRLYATDNVTGLKIYTSDPCTQN
jgi:hypothetical protein